MGKFEEIKFDKTTSLQKDGMEISAFIAGVNSGQYNLPFLISVKVWARKWFFKKFFYREMHLDLHEIKILKNECEKVLNYYEEKQKEITEKQQMIINRSSLIQKK